MHKLFEEHCEQAHRLLAPYGARRLSASELAQHGFKCFRAGWQIDGELNYQDEPVSFCLLLPSGAPNQRPRVAALTPSGLKPLSFPHVERAGLLCVWDEQALVDPQQPDYLVDLLCDARDMMVANFSGKLDTDFEAEFLSYWSYHCSDTEYATNLCDHTKQHSRPIWTFRSARDGYIFADSKEQLIAWLEKRGQLIPSAKTKVYQRTLDKIQPSVVYYFNRPWRPVDYPNSMGDFLSLLKAESGTQFEQYLQWLGRAISNSTTTHPAFLVAFQTPTGTCYASLVCQRNLHDRHNRKALSDGFRHRIPLDTLYARLSHVPLHGLVVNRADYHWIVGREHNPAAQRLPQAGQVLIIGCGAVGSGVARILVQSGVTDITLVDGQNLESANISRHALGYSSVGLNKATQLAKVLQAEFPYANIKAKAEDWQNALSADNGQNQTWLMDADLIVSCTADWYSDRGLLEMQSRHSLAPILFAFVEAEAIAGHVIINPTDSNAFASLHHYEGEQVGTFRWRVCQWPQPTLKRLPACGGTFQPYGMIDLSHLVSLAAGSALNLLLSEQEIISPSWQVWIGQRDQLRQKGGQWHQAWCQQFGDPGPGGQIRHFILNNGMWIDNND